MQKASSSVSSGAIAPTVIGPQKDMKEVYILFGLVLLLAGGLGAFWYYSGQDQSFASKTPLATLTGAQVTNVLKSSSTPAIEPVANRQLGKSDSIHTDIYFEVGRKGLTDEAKVLLATQADLAKNDSDLGILVQGYTDQQGSATYNKKLGLMRGEKVKEFLVSQGVADYAIKVVSLGEEGVLCIDTSDICRNMNRRVHLEIRKIGQEHMVVPALATTPSQTSIDSSVATEDSGFRTEDLPPPSEPTGVATEPPSGS